MSGERIIYDRQSQIHKLAESGSCPRCQDFRTDGDRLHRRCGADLRRKLGTGFVRVRARCAAVFAHERRRSARTGGQVMTTVERILEIARSQIGTAATNIKRCKYNEWYYGGSVSGDAFDWCEVFVQWVFDQAGASSLLYTKTANCGYAAKAFQDKGRLVMSGYKPGDVVFFHWGSERSTLVPGTYVSDHVGIIEKVNADGTYTTIEGNTGGGNGKVLRCIRERGVISCAGRPVYSASSSSSATTTTTKKGECDLKFKYLAKSGYTSRGEQVKTAQRLLNALGCKGKDGKSLVVDGIFGNNTECAVIQFQKMKKLTANGIVDVSTWKALTAAT